MKQNSVRNSLTKFWLMTFLLLIGIAGPIIAQPPATESQPAKDPKVAQIEELVRQAQAALDKGQASEAEARCQQALKIDEKSTLARANLARVLATLDKQDEALKEIERALESPARDSDAREARSQAFAVKSSILYDRGEFLPAIDAAYLGTLEKYDNAELHLNRAKAYIARRDYDKAINSLNRAIGIDSKLAEAHSLRGFAYGLKENYGQCVNDQTKALELAPQYALALQRRASAYLQQKKPAEAVKDLDQALRLKPDLAEALCDRAIMRTVGRDTAGAMADVEAAIKSDPKCLRAHLLKAQALIGQERWDDAIKALDHSLKYGSDLAIYLTRGLAYQSRKKYGESIEDFTKVLEQDPQNLAAYKARAVSYRKAGNEELAKADLNMVRDLSPTPDEKETKDSKGKKKKDKSADEDKVPPPMLTLSNKPVEAKALQAVKQMAAEIDRLVAASHKKHQVQPNPKTTDEQFVRRVYLDLAGRIPSYQETTKFLSAKEADKRSALIDSLLGSDGYANHYFNYWADVLRYKDDLSNDVRGEPYRQWIKQSLAENKPWNKMVYELLTAEGLIWENPATGYFQRDPGMPLDVMNNTIRIFLGTRIGCAQCHDHPFDRWTQREFYEMAAFTIGTQTSTNGKNKKIWDNDPKDRLKGEFDKIVQEEEDRRNNSYRFDRMINVNMKIVHDQADKKIRLPKDYQYKDAKPNDIVNPKTIFGQPVEMKPGQSPRAAFARWAVAKENPRFAKTIANRLWKQMFGAGQIEPVDNVMDDTVAENPELMDHLESLMKRINFNMKEFIRILAYTDAYQRQASVWDTGSSLPYRFPGPVLRRMTAEQAWDSFVTLAVSGAEYRELPATMRAEAVDLDLKKDTAQTVLDAVKKSQEVDRENGKIQSKFRYRGELLARASELPQPLPPNHFLRVFGQSDRELIAASSTTGSVPQILFMFNGPITHMLLEKNSTIYNNIVKKTSLAEGVRTVFLTVLSRQPEADELEIGIQAVKEAGAAGYGNVVWSLVNTREFLFVQ